MLSLTLLCLVGAIGLSVAEVAPEAPFKTEEDSVARILVTKLIQNKYLVESMDVLVRYSLYNVGTAAALDVRVRDYNFAPTDFRVVAGQAGFQLARLAPGANATHALVVQPLKNGYFNFTAAEVSYLASADTAERTVGFTSESGEAGIVAFRDFDKKFSPHLVDWVFFAIVTLPSLGIPFMLWLSSKSKYDSILREKRAEATKKRE